MKNSHISSLNLSQSSNYSNESDTTNDLIKETKKLTLDDIFDGMF